MFDKINILCYNTCVNAMNKKSKIEESNRKLMVDGNKCFNYPKET